MALPEFLTKTTAGLPNWAWGIAIVGGIAVAIFFNKSTATPATTEAGVSPGPQPGPQGPPGIAGPQGPPVPTPVPPGPTGPPIMPPQGGSHIPYTVVSGDTVNSIAAKEGITPDHLWQDNRYDICSCMKSKGVVCSYKRGPLDATVASTPLCPGRILYY